MGCGGSKEAGHGADATPIGVGSSSSSPETTPPKKPDAAQGAVNGHASWQQPGVRSSPTQPLAVDSSGEPRRDSPGMRVTTRVLKPKQPREDDIVTVWDDNTSPHTSNQQGGEQQLQHAHLPGSTAAVVAVEHAEEEDSGRLLPRQDSVKASTPALVTLQRDVASSPSSQDPLEQSLKGLKPVPVAQHPVGKPRYPPPSEMIMSISDDDDDDSAGSAGFNMARWKRHYHWNKHKHQELLRFLWKRYDKHSWTIYCMSHKQQGAMFSAYQGENVIHGFQCRVQQLLASGTPGSTPTANALAPAGPPHNTAKAAAASQLPDLFGVLHTLVDKEDPSVHKVVGMLLARGAGSAPACLSGLLELEDWHIQPADVADPLVRTFVSNLVTAQPPAPQYLVVHTREIL